MRQVAISHRILILGCLGALVTACGGAAFSDEAPSGGYFLLVGDELEISVWGRDELNRKVQIKDDGTFIFPILGEIQAAGRSLKEVEREMLERLKASIASTTAQKENSPSPETPRRVIPAGDVRSEIYHLGISDELDVTVWSHDDLNRKVQIREDGTFGFPLIGEVQAAGRSLKEVEREMQERLDRDYIVNPQVTARISGAKISILGAVASPGSYPIESTSDLLTVISQAGGLTKLGSSQVELTRLQGKETVTIAANIDRIIQGKEPNVNILPRDAIYVVGRPAEELQVTLKLAGAKFSVLGEVERPGSYPIEGTMDLLTAMSQAGGVTKFGSNRIEIIRGQKDRKTVIRANIDRIIQGKESNVEILPRDTIYVKRRLF